MMEELIEGKDTHSDEPNPGPGVPLDHGGIELCRVDGRSAHDALVEALRADTDSVTEPGGDPARIRVVRDRVGRCVDKVFPWEPAQGFDDRRGDEGVVVVGQDGDQRADCEVGAVRHHVYLGCISAVLCTYVCTYKSTW